jgi:hypothetical protein
MRAITIVLVCLQLSACAGTPPRRGCDPVPAPTRGDPVDQVNSAFEAIIVALFMLVGIMTAKTPLPCDRADVRLP